MELLQQAAGSWGQGAQAADSFHQPTPGWRVRGPQPLPQQALGVVSLEGTTCTGHPTHVQVGGDRLRCPLAGVTGASGSPHASGPASNQSRGSRDLGAGWGSGRQVLPHPDFSRKPAPRAFRARLSPRWALGGARLSPATRLGARLGSAAAAARAFLRSSACGRARPARAHAGHQVRGGRRRVSVRHGAAGGPGEPAPAGRAASGRGQGEGAVRARPGRARRGGVPAGPREATSLGPPDAARSPGLAWPSPGLPVGGARPLTCAAPSTGRALPCHPSRVAGTLPRAWG